MNSDFERLLLIFRRARSLPDLPQSAIRLIKVIDTEEASAVDIERIVAADPGLTGAFLRMSNGMSSGDAHVEVSTIRMAIMRMGQRSVRSLAMSLVVHDLLKERTGFNAQRYASHSLFVAFMSRYLYARRAKATGLESEWSADEIFAAGLMHDLGLALLSKVVPDVYQRVAGFAKRAGVSMDNSFTQLYKSPIGELGSAAAAAWGFPPMFVTSMKCFSEPWTYDQEYTCLCCLNYANYLAETCGAATEEWPFEAQLAPEVGLEIGLDEEEIAKVVEAVSRHASSYLAAAA